MTKEERMMKILREYNPYMYDYSRLPKNKSPKPSQLCNEML